MESIEPLPPSTEALYYTQVRLNFVAGRRGTYPSLPTERVPRMIGSLITNSSALYVVGTRYGITLQL